MRRGKNPLWGALRALLLPALIVAVLVGFTTALDNLTDGRRQEDLAQLETALRRAAVACYAVEGSYPQDLDYLKDRYGVQIDETRYAVDYRVFGSNLMPSITVLELAP